MIYRYQRRIRGETCRTTQALVSNVMRCLGAILIRQLMPVRGISTEHDIDHFDASARRVTHAVCQPFIVPSKLVDIIARDHGDAGLLQCRNAFAQQVGWRQPVILLPPDWKT